MGFATQPGYIIQMRAKKGMGDKLFRLATEGMFKSDASDRFIMLREDADPDVLWNIEIFRSEEDRARYENSPLADELRDEILEIVEEMVMRVEVHPYAAIPALPGDKD